MASQNCHQFPTWMDNNNKTQMDPTWSNPDLANLTPASPAWNNSEQIEHHTVRAPYQPILFTAKDTCTPPHSNLWMISMLLIIASCISIQQSYYSTNPSCCLASVWTPTSNNFFFGLISETVAGTASQLDKVEVVIKPRPWIQLHVPVATATITGAGYTDNFI